LHKNNKAVVISTKGYIKLIGFLQYAHLPFKNTNDKTGIFIAFFAISSHKLFNSHLYCPFLVVFSYYHPMITTGTPLRPEGQILVIVRQNLIHHGTRHSSPQVVLFTSDFHPLLDFTLESRHFAYVVKYGLALSVG